jgi:large subunit ribosomal protein L13
MKNFYDTYSVKENDIKRDWHLADAEGQVLGRLATKVATILKGKHKTIFQPNMDVGDFVVVINVDKLKVTGNKYLDKIYYSHSGFPGGLKEINFKDLIQKNPERLFRHAIKGMLPKGRLGNRMIKKLKLYAGDVHPHDAQSPIVLSL